jgi:hypothetical protein
VSSGSRPESGVTLVPTWTLTQRYLLTSVELDALQLPTKVGSTAVDLGAGFGLHALPLAGSNP